MATLTGQSIDSSYQGLIKTTDNGAITGTAKAVTDGLGNATNIEISNTATNFVSGTVDFTGATVSGLPGGAAGLESGTGADSMQSAASLTTQAANASGAKTIALGNNATASSEGNIALGMSADAGGDAAFARVNIAIGRTATANNEKDIAIGDNANATGSRSVAIGDNTFASAGRAIALGNNAQCTAFSAMCLGNSSTASAEGSIVLGGFNSSATALNAIALGKEADATGIEAIAIGYQTQASGQDAISMGTATTAAGQDAIAMGNTVEAPNNGDVNIGTSNLNAKTGLPGDVLIGKNNNSSTTNGGQNVMIGTDNQITQNERSNIIGYGNTVSRGSHSILGEQNTSSSNYQIAIVGNSNTSTGEKTFVGGHNSGATATGAVALGDGVTASTAQTVSVKALETQTNSTPTAGGIIMADAGGTDRRLNVTSEGNLQLGTEIVGIVGWSTTKVSENQAASSCDTTRASVKIPAGTVKAGDILQIKSLEQRSGSTGFTYSNLAIHTAGTIGQTQAGAFVSGFQSTADGFGAHSKTLFVQTVDGTGDGTQYLEDNYNPQEQQGGIFSSNLGTNTAIDWTVDQYLCVNVCIDNAGATWTNYGASLTIIGRN